MTRLAAASTWGAQAPAPFCFSLAVTSRGGVGAVCATGAAAGPAGGAPGGDAGAAAGGAA